MKFNKFVWDLYKGARTGESTVSRFLHPSSELVDEELREMEYSLVDADGTSVGDASVDVAEALQNYAADEKFGSQTEANRFLGEVIHNGGFPFRFDHKGIEADLVFGDHDEHWYDFVAGVSLGLYMAHPDFFLPYNFRRKFNQLEEIHAEFGIPLPPIPGKSDKRGRALYYISINQAWQEFRTLHQMSPAEMCAFLYDFAVQSTTPLDVSDLPLPSKVWLVSGGAGGAADFDLVDGATEATIDSWAGNPGVRRGDILLMYLISPRCYIDSVWRAGSDAFIDPFFHYHSQVWICRPTKAKPVTFAELKQHPLLSHKSAIRGNFQGPNSKAPFTVEEYDAVLQMMENKGQDLSILPRIPLSNYLPDIELSNERDVEVMLIEPFLKRLGYNESDWIRQMAVKMGRGERNYPDYAFGAKTKRGEESAAMVCESKYQLSAHRDFTEAFYQAKSYALRLRCKVMVTAAKEGVWVFPSEDGNFEIKKYIHKSWSELSHPDTFHGLLSLIGRDKVLC